MLLEGPDVRLNYEVIGEGTPVTVLHGFTQSWRSWHEVISHMPDGWRWVVPDLRGVVSRADRRVQPRRERERVAAGRLERRLDRRRPAVKRTEDTAALQRIADQRVAQEVVTVDLELEEVALAYLERVVGVRVVASLDEITATDEELASISAPPPGISTG